LLTETQKNPTTLETWEQLSFFLYIWIHLILVFFTFLHSGVATDISSWTARRACARASWSQ